MHGVVIGEEKLWNKHVNKRFVVHTTRVFLEKGFELSTCYLFVYI